jgi:hypothetical protein
MSDFSKLSADLSQDQQAIQAKCFHPTGTFVAIKKDEVRRPELKCHDFSSRPSPSSDRTARARRHGAVPKLTGLSLFRTLA